MPPDVEIYREPQILWTYSARDVVTCNIVCWARPDKDGERAMVDRVTERHRNVTSNWYMTPSYQNQAMAYELEKHGYKLISECESYVCDVDSWTSVPNDSISVLSVETMDDLRNYFLVLNEVYGLNTIRSQADLEYYLEVCTGNDRQVARFVAYDRPNGTPISVAGVTISKTSSFGLLWAGSTRKAYRGLGAYRALVDARIQFLKKRDVLGAGLYANIKTSAPIVAKLGFDRGASMHDWCKLKS